jgi:hypothetical protein
MKRLANGTGANTRYARLLGGGLLAAVAAVLIAGQALAAAETRGGADTPCFFITQWGGWKAPNPKVIYLGVAMHQVYRLDLSYDVPQLMWPDVHLVSRVRGPATMCSALDFQLYVSQSAPFDNRTFTDGGFLVAVIARKLTKLTPEEVAAIPKKYNPN